jgi:hypothetical protein
VLLFEEKIPFAKDSSSVRQSYPSLTVNFGSGSQCSSHYLKAHGFLGTRGSSATHRIFHLTSRFPVFGRISPRSTLALATRHVVWRKDVYRIGGIVSGQRQKRCAGSHRPQ